MLQIIDSLAGLRDWQANQTQAHPESRRAVVMTMGALHAGHMSLVDHARQLVGANGEVLVTIFVNPLQFGANEDLDRYPRTFADDVALCQEHGADAIFAPTSELMYPDSPATTGITIQPGPLGELYEGASRPTHFVGVLTVVAKLLNLTKPQYAIFGEKDYQQLALIQAMARELNFETEIVGSPIIRDETGLALSSRNRYLDPAELVAASEISTAIDRAKQVALAGGAPIEIEDAVSTHLAKFPLLRLDYVALTSPELQRPPDSGPARILVAVYCGATRLLDNTEVMINHVN